MAGPYSSLNEARGMAALLAHFDWTKPVEEFRDEEIKTIVGLATQFREDLEFAQHMRRISGEE